MDRLWCQRPPPSTSFGFPRQRGIYRGGRRCGRVSGDRAEGGRGQHRRPADGAGGAAALEFQAKATGAGPLPEGEAGFGFDLSLKNYNDLRLDGVLVPRILIVVRVPQAEADWLCHSEAELALRRCGYWLSLAGMPEVDNQTSRRVTIPRANVFDPSTLRALMARIGQGGTP